MRRPRRRQDDENQPEPGGSLRTTRMEAFSDGVFAIAITLLVLEISLPEGKEIGEGLLALWPSYVAYVTSFLTIGGAWLSHTLVTEYLSTADAVLLRLNLALLLVVAFLPFPTTLLAESMDITDEARIVAPFYGMVLLAIALLTSAMWRYGLRAGLVRPDLHDGEVRALTRRLSPALAFYLVSIVIGLLIPRLAPLLYMAIAIYVLVPIASGYRGAKAAPATSAGDT